MKLKIFLFSAFLAWSTLIFSRIAADAKDFPILDGRTYNGQYYPMVDIIEWTQDVTDRAPASGSAKPEPHMEFHIHKSAADPVELSAVAGNKGGKAVLWLTFHFPARGEKLCRHVLAPFHFKEGDKLVAYKDMRIPDYTNIYVSNYPLVTDAHMQPYNLLPYERCADPEINSNMPMPGAIAETPSNPSSNRSPASTVSAPIPPVNPKGLGIDYENSAVPFSF
jgi:hypothetical protein